MQINSIIYFKFCYTFTFTATKLFQSKSNVGHLILIQQNIFVWVFCVGDSYQSNVNITLLLLRHEFLIHFATLINNKFTAFRDKICRFILLDCSMSREELSSAEMTLLPLLLLRSQLVFKRLNVPLLKQSGSPKTVESCWKFGIRPAHQLKHSTTQHPPSNSSWIMLQSLISLSMNGEPVSPEEPSSRVDGLYEWMDHRRLCSPRPRLSPVC